MSRNEICRAAKRCAGFRKKRHPHAATTELVVEGALFSIEIDRVKKG
jgi:hypothetical protein